jgi:hypothetical protein
MSKISKEEFKKKLIDFIASQNNNLLDKLRKKLEEDNNCSGDYPTKPGKPNLDNIASTGETAFQRGIFNGEYSILNYGKEIVNKKVVWNDIELPVTLNKNSRRISIDLIGLINNQPVLCELKFHGKSPSKDQPIYAIVELLMYHYFIQCNYKKLDKYNVHHDLLLKEFGWEIIVENNTSQLLVVANKKYWDYWFKKISKKELLKQTLALSKDLTTNIHLFETHDEDYIGQKGKQKTYKPIISSSIWTKIE